MAARYLLLDANVVASYYLPRAHSSKRVRERIESILNLARNDPSTYFLYIPNFCIAEVFGVFAKHAYGHWNHHVKKAGTIDKRVYRSLVRQFAEDIHNARFFYHYELSRYHVLGVDLIAPVDHYFQIRRGDSRRHIPMGTFDQLILSMGIHLAHIHGSANVAIVSADDRLTDILDKCISGIPAKTIRKLRLDIAEEFTGKPFTPSIFPMSLNLKNASKAQLEKVLGRWPLVPGKKPKIYRWTRLV